MAFFIPPPVPRSCFSWLICISTLCPKLLITWSEIWAQISDHVINNFGQRVEIHISHEKQLLGTGGGIKKAISDFGNEDIVVINSDIYSDLDYRCFRNFSANTLFVVPANQLIGRNYK